MTTFRNTAKGARGILLTSGAYVMIDPGESKSVPGDKIKTIAEGLQIINPAEAEPGRVAEGGAEAELPASPSSLSELRTSEGTGEPMQPIPAIADGQMHEADLSQLDHDGDGKPGGSLPHEPPALSGMTKAQLVDQAQAEGILLDHIKGTGANGNVLADDIKAAIEAKRAAQS